MKIGQSGQNQNKAGIFIQKTLLSSIRLPDCSIVASLVSEADKRSLSPISEAEDLQMRYVCPLIHAHRLTVM